MMKILVTLHMDDEDPVAIAYYNYLRAKQELQHALSMEGIEAQANESAASGN